MRETWRKRFGSALSLNIRFHMLVLDGAYLVGTEPPVFRRISTMGTPVIRYRRDGPVGDLVIAVEVCMFNARTSVSRQVP